MKAARYHQTDKGYLLQCDEIAVPTCGENEVRVRVAFCGICGSDLARYREISQPSDNLKNLFGKISFIQGHEFSGVIDQIGSRVIEQWEDASPVIGTPVAIHPLIGCGACVECRNKNWNRCKYPEISQVIGVHRDGGFAEYVTVPFDHVIPLGERVSLETAALTEPLAVALHSVNVAQIPSVETPVMIIGDGTLGLLIAHILKQRAHQEVCLVGRHTERLALARKMGASVIRDMREVDSLTVRSMKFIFQVAGSQVAVEKGLELLSGNGQMICLGYLHSISDGLGPSAFNDLIRNQKCMRGSFGSSYAEFESALGGLNSGDYDVSPLIGARISLDMIIERGFEELLREPKPAGKVLVRPGQI
jgi:(R,R)-butanediol dehydrogenase/meso-butanediol dehydrogenase/diacetyl reductase